MVKDVTDTGCPVTMEVDDKFRSDPLVPTLPSSTKVFPEVTIRNQVAVPVAFAEESWVIELRVSTPPEAAGANVALHVSSASRVVGVPPVAGRDPS